MKIKRDIVRKCSGSEDVPSSHIEQGISSGIIVAPANNNRDMSRPCAIGKGLRTKVNANIGMSPGYSGINEEMKKMEAAVQAGADALMDLSLGPLLGKLRKKILAECPLPLGTVPVYELACDGNKKFLSLKEDDFIEILEKQASEGVDFFTIHSGITYEAIGHISPKSRILNIVSRGGAMIASWMKTNRRENPFRSRFDDVIKIARKHNVTLSLGDSLRPGAIADATDRLQIHELLVLGDQQKQAFERGVQVMIEGPGHVAMDQIEANVKLQKTICHGAPFYVLGPLVTDAAPGYDHIVGAIGGALAAWHGADFLCYVTPAEHLRLPGIEDVRQGVIASRIAAHAADIVKGLPSAIKRDRDISMARAKRDWDTQFKLAIDKDLPAKVRKGSHPKVKDICTMCSEYCSIKVTEDTFLKKGDKKNGLSAEKGRR
ncbi:MAG: phosphomethylpyrimidine synthase ThiC [Candidatus Omnitrophica bacterium]|nr:phosphomethylpyrimidine synthase ThiC [Candidatus Omnitrophota bacterium]MDD5487339.1 phosphomethylpyrimidine synthase ThiC [Candidatus Omnitrophota bacterium]